MDILFDVFRLLLHGHGWPQDLWKEGRKEGMEWNGMEWNGTERYGTEWNGSE